MNYKIKIGIVVFSVFLIILAVLLYFKVKSSQKDNKYPVDTVVDTVVDTSIPTVTFIKKVDGRKKYFAIFKDRENVPELIKNLRNNKNVSIINIVNDKTVLLYTTFSESKRLQPLFSLLTDKEIPTIGLNFDINTYSWNQTFKKFPNIKTVGNKNFEAPVQFVSPTSLVELLASYQVLKKSDIDLVKFYKPTFSYNSTEFKNSYRTYKNKVNTLVRNYDTKKRNLFDKTQRKLSNRGLKIETFEPQITGVPQWIGDILVSVFYDIPKKVADAIVDAADSLSEEVQKAIGALTGSSCKKLSGKVAVGFVFIESSVPGDTATFTTNEKNSLKFNVELGHSLLTQNHPTNNLSWYYDYQYVKINVESKEAGFSKSSDNYFKDPALEKITFNGKHFSGNTFGVNDYLSELKKVKNCDYAIMIFMSAYPSSWFAYAVPYNGSITMSRNNNYEGWGISDIWKVFAHETCHLFGAADEYSYSSEQATSIGADIVNWWNNCDSTFGCNKTPNSNAESCCEPNPPNGQVQCLMDTNEPQLCPASQGQIGWVDKYIRAEITTGGDWWSGTDSNIYIIFKSDNNKNIKQQLNLPWSNDFENSDVQTYDLWNGNITRDSLLKSFSVQIESVAFGIIDDWKLARIRLFYKDELVRDLTPNVWLTKTNPTWTASQLNLNTENNNFVQVEITTGTDWWSGTDNDVYFTLKDGKSYKLDSAKNDFENGDTATYVISDNNINNKNMLNKFKISLIPYNVASISEADDWKLQKVKVFFKNDVVAQYSPNVWLTEDNPSWTAPS